MGFKKKIISFLSAPGGVGKTTLALVFSLFLSLDGKRVLMLDLDPSYGLSLRVLSFRVYQGRVRNGKTIDRLIKKFHEGEEDVDYRDYVTECRYHGIFFNLIISTERLSEVIDTIWYGSEAGREYLLRDVIENLGLLNDWDLVILDTIPFYEPKYSILTYMASDLCIVPLRPSIIDVTRTINMLNTLKRKIRRIIRDERELMSRFGIVFNLVWKGRRSERKIPEYKNRISNETSPHAYLFEKYILDREAFRRINTQEETRSDLNTIQQIFSPVYEETLNLIKRV